MEYRNISNYEYSYALRVNESMTSKISAFQEINFATFCKYISFYVWIFWEGWTNMDVSQIT